MCVIDRFWFLQFVVRISGCSFFTVIRHTFFLHFITLSFTHFPGVSAINTMSSRYISFSPAIIIMDLGKNPIFKCRLAVKVE